MMGGGSAVLGRHLGVARGKQRWREPAAGGGGGKAVPAAEAGAHRLERLWQRARCRQRSGQAAGGRADAPAVASSTLLQLLAAPRRATALPRLIWKLGTYRSARGAGFRTTKQSAAWEAEARAAARNNVINRSVQARWAPQEARRRHGRANAQAALPKGVAF